MKPCAHLYRQSPDTGRLTCVLCEHSMTGDSTKDLPPLVAGELQRLSADLRELRRAITQDPRFRYGYMDRDEAAKYLGISTRTLERWTTEELVPHSKVGKVIRYYRPDLDQCMLDFKHTQKPRKGKAS